MLTKSVLVTGANRGIGLGFIKQLLIEGKYDFVFAACRDLDKAEELKQLDFEALHLIEMDVNNDISIKRAVEMVESLVGDSGLSLLINNAGIENAHKTDDPPNRELLRSVVETNAISVAVVTQFFLPLLKKASRRDGHSDVVNISSLFGSISQNDIGSGRDLGLLPYRTSKAALNMITRTMAIDLADDNIAVVAISPGWVKTDMGGSDAVLTVMESVSLLMKFIRDLDVSKSGFFFDRFGKKLDF